MKSFALLVLTAALQAAPIPINSGAPCGPVSNNLVATELPGAAIKVSGSFSATVTPNNEGCSINFFVDAPITVPVNDFMLQLFNSIQWNLDIESNGYALNGEFESTYYVSGGEVSIASPLFGVPQSNYAESSPFQWVLPENTSTVTLRFDFYISAFGEGVGSSLPFTMDFGNNSLDGYTNLTPASTSVPEPGTCALATLGIAALLLRRKTFHS